MKAFEKWSEVCPRKDGDCGNMRCTECEKIQAATWRAALKIVNSKLWLASGQVADEVKVWIKEELEQ